MTIEFDKSFEKFLVKINNKALFKKVKKIIVELEIAETLADFKNAKKLTGFKYYYRIRIGNYRLGLERSMMRFFDSSF